MQKIVLARMSGTGGIREEILKAETMELEIYHWCATVSEYADKRFH